MGSTIDASQFYLARGRGRSDTLLLVRVAVIWVVLIALVLVPFFLFEEQFDAFAAQMTSFCVTPPASCVEKATTQRL